MMSRQLWIPWDMYEIDAGKFMAAYTRICTLSQFLIRRDRDNLRHNKREWPEFTKQDLDWVTSDATVISEVGRQLDLLASNPYFLRGVLRDAPVRRPAFESFLCDGFTSGVLVCAFCSFSFALDPSNDCIGATECCRNMGNVTRGRRI